MNQRKEVEENLQNIIKQLEWTLMDLKKLKEETSNPLVDPNFIITDTIQILTQGMYSGIRLDVLAKLYKGN